MSSDGSQAPENMEAIFPSPTASFHPSDHVVRLVATKPSSIIFLPEFGEGSRTLIVGEVDRHVFAVVGGGERTASGKPDHRVVEAGVTRIGCDVHADAFQLFGRLVIVVPRANLGGIDAYLLEHAVVVEERHWTGIHGKAVHAAVQLHRSPRTGRVEIAVAFRTPGDRHQLAAYRVLAQRIVFQLHHVGNAVTVLDGVVEFVVTACVLPNNVDVGVSFS